MEASAADVVTFDSGRHRSAERRRSLSLNNLLHRSVVRLISDNKRNNPYSTTTPSFQAKQACRFLALQHFPPLQYRAVFTARQHSLLCRALY